MKARTRYNILILIGGIFGYAGFFHTSIGLPDWVEWPFNLIFIACIWTVVWLQRRAKRRGDPSFVPATPEQHRRLTWLMVVVAFLTCLASPFVLPYTGVTLPFPQLVAVSGFTFLVFAALIIVMRRRQQRPNHALQRTAGRSDA